jgi:hypothetical protein
MKTADKQKNPREETPSLEEGRKRKGRRKRREEKEIDHR